MLFLDSQVFLKVTPFCLFSSWNLQSFPWLLIIVTTLLLSFWFHLPSSQDPRNDFHKWSNHYCLCTMTHCFLFWLLQLNSVSPISQVVQIPVQTEFSYLKTPPISSFKKPTGFSVVKNFPMSQKHSGIWAQHTFSLLALLNFISA